MYPGLRRDGRQIAYRSAPRPPMPPTAPRIRTRQADRTSWKSAPDHSTDTRYWTQHLGRRFECGRRFGSHFDRVSHFQDCGPLFGPYKSSLRVRLRNLIESVCAALNPVTPPRDDAVASGRPEVLCRSSQPAGKICQPVPDGSQVPLPLRCWSGRPRPTARRWSAPRCTRRSRRRAGGWR